MGQYKSIKSNNVFFFLANITHWLQGVSGTSFHHQLLGFRIALAHVPSRISSPCEALEPCGDSCHLPGAPGLWSKWPALAPDNIRLWSRP